MKTRILKTTFTLLFCGFLFGGAAVYTFSQHSISGMIFDNNRHPVSDIEVELLDSLERLIATRRTRSGGFYTFQRLNKGIYYLKPRVSGTNYKENKLRIDLGDFSSIGGIDAKQINIFLELDPRKTYQTPTNNTIIFAQNVPDEARKLYESGLEDLKKERTQEAKNQFLKAAQIFPEYFYALESLGDIYLSENKYIEAENVFLRAVKINPKSFRTLFSLATAQNKLNRKNEAAESLKKANILDPNSINANLLLGIIQRDLKKYKEAEKSLLRAKQLSKDQVADVNWNLALLYYHDLKLYTAAANELELYIKAMPEDQKRNSEQKIIQIKKLISHFRNLAQGT